MKSFTNNGDGGTSFLWIVEGFGGGDEIGLSLHEVIESNAGDSL